VPETVNKPSTRATKEITRGEIAVFLRLSAKLNDGNKVLRCDREKVRSARFQFIDPNVRKDTPLLKSQWAKQITLVRSQRCLSESGTT